MCSCALHTRTVLTATATGSGGLRDAWYANTSTYPITWNKSAAVLPQTLYGHAMAITDSGIMWISAGRVSTTRFTNALLSMDVTSLSLPGSEWEQWTPLTPSRRADGDAFASTQSGDVPSERWNHNMVALHETLWLMGGQAPDGSISDGAMYVLDTATEPLRWQKKDLASVVPEPRHSFGMAAVGNVIYVSKCFFFCV
jgi:hypothetical protein